MALTSESMSRQFNDPSNGCLGPDGLVEMWVASSPTEAVARDDSPPPEEEGEGRGARLLRRVDQLRAGDLARLCLFFSFFLLCIFLPLLFVSSAVCLQFSHISPGPKE